MLEQSLVAIICGMALLRIVQSWTAPEQRARDVMRRRSDADIRRALDR